MMHFLSKYPDSEPLHVELAKFEWSFGKVLEDADAPQLTLADMAQIPPESWGEMRLSLHPSMRLLDLQYNSPEIWQALFEDTEPPAVVRYDETSTWMLWRFNMMTHYRPLNPQHLWMVRNVQKDATFAELCEGLCEFMGEEEVAQFAGMTLKEWLDQGLVSRLSV